MTKKEKLVDRFLTRPKDFTFKDVESLLKAVGFEKGKPGRTRGARVFFYHYESGLKIKLHKPHGNKKALYGYELDLVQEVLRALDQFQGTNKNK